MIEDTLPINTISKNRVNQLASAFSLSQNQTLLLLRLGLAIIFFWFGALKLAGSSPVVELLQHSFPLLARQPYIELLGIGEMLLGIGLLFDRSAKLVAGLLILHLLGTFSVALVAPQMLFAPSFPILTMQGEFVTKNIILIISALVIAFGRAEVSISKARS